MLCDVDNVGEAAAFSIKLWHPTLPFPIPISTAPNLYNEDRSRNWLLRF